MLPYHRKLLSAVGGGGFQVDAVTFDGSNDHLNRGADLTGNSDGTTGIFSCWLKSNSDVGTQIIYQNANDQFIIRKESGTNLIRVIIKDTSFNADVEITSSNGYTTADGWFHVLVAWNTATTTGQMYINDASDIGVNNIVSDTLDYTQAEHVIGANSGGSGEFLNADMAEFYLNLGEYLDISSSANRRKFISASSKPVDLGSDGSLPTGTAPIIYLNGPATGFETNNGTGGNFTENGTLTDASTSPSD